ncbi:MAG TPA: ATP-binding cassette domain-containing protein [Streptosporangiaceae bacterium]|nr:ATP-binding cassette domain-containing protein [Streptosporangiaceae bacterium]
MRLDGVGKRYGFRQPWVVRDVSLDIGPARLVRFEGKNGTGKSTLLRMIAGVSVPSKGTVTGRPITGYVPERFPPALPFTARDYLAHIGRIQGLAGDPLHARIDACLDRLGGLEFAGVPLRNMSKGMCQKVAVAQALLPSAGLLVLDEAWTGLDVDAKAALDGAVAERLADGGSVVYVDHDPARLAYLDPERWRIEHGEAVQAASGGGATPGPAGHGQAGPTVEIEVIGCPEGLIGQLPDVLGVRRDGDRAFVTVPASASDLTLRRLLAAGDGVHIRHVDYRAEYGIGRDGGPR